MTRLTRRDFLGRGLRAGKRIAATAIGKDSETQQDAPRQAAELEAIAGDFPPEMLRMEAQRLGLDPDSLDRTALLTAVFEAMAAAGGPRASGS